MRMYHGYMTNHGSIVEYRRNQNQSNILASLSTIKLDVQNGQPVVGERMVIVMEEICPMFTILETRSITKTLNVMMNQAMIIGKDGRAMRFTTIIMIKENVKAKLMKKDISYVVSKLARYRSTKIKRYKMIKYSFNDEEEYVAVKEDEYDDLIITSEEACRAYQEIFRMMDEGWMELVKVTSTNIGGDFTNLEDLEVLES
ncbi:hypothetical protein Tco_1384113 [Tanacetum coccineum]